MLSKIGVLLGMLVAVQSVAIWNHGPLIHHSGTSVQTRKQDAAGNYGFGYSIADGSGATNSRSEVGDGHGHTVGAYTLTDTDGRARRVDYVADGAGFRAKVQTNEPGTAMSAPAAAVIISPHAGPKQVIAHHPALVAGHGLGVHGLGVHGLGVHGWGLHGLGAHGLVAHGHDIHGLGHHGLVHGAHGLGLVGHHGLIL